MVDEHNPYPHNEAAMKRMDEAKPTPTQRENDEAALRALGQHVDAGKVAEKEPAKSGDDEDETKEKDLAAEKPGKYKTRNVEAAPERKDRP